MKRRRLKDWELTLTDAEAVGEESGQRGAVWMERAMKWYKH
jgi:hypothetical protein